MARTIAEIKTELGNTYINNTEVVQKYQLSTTDLEAGFDALFSKVSVENLLFYAIATAIHIFERILDTFMSEIQTKTEQAFYFNEAWWHQSIMSFQLGDDLKLNQQNFRFDYPAYDVEKRIVKKCAIREKTDTDGIFKVFFYTVKDENNALVPLSVAELNALNAYVNQIKPCGVITRLISGVADTLTFSLTVNYNPLVLNGNGEMLGTSEKPVENAIYQFIDTLNENYFGGDLNITRLVDAIQQTSGVVDVRINAISINGTLQTEGAVNKIWGTFSSTNGWFTINSLNIAYQPQNNL